MRLLFDTHFVLAFLRREFSARYPRHHRLFMDTRNSVSVSVVSIWEIAIKSKLGKLDPGLPLERIPRAFEEAELTVRSIELPHVITFAHPEPPTRDPFDRLLLAQCDVEDLQLVTIDRALADHRLAFRL